jgi:uncharacterized membrane-anchored protein YitT (DUF2179 family)
MNKHKRILKDIIEVIIGVFMMAFSYYFFFSPSKLCNGGISGITIIIKSTPIAQLSWYRDWMFMYFIQAILLVCALIFVGKDFFLKTILACILDPTFNLLFDKCGANPEYFLQAIPSSNWYLISMLFGGLISAVGIGICLRVNSSTGGMDILQKILQQKLHIPYSKSMYLTDWLVVLCSGFFISNLSQFHGNVVNEWVYNIEMVLYGMITVWLTGYICDYLALNAKTRRTAYIITNNVDVIRNYIFDEFDRGLTIVDCVGGYTNQKRKMIICTIEKAQCYILKDKLKELDPLAFTFFSETKEIVGDYV